MFCTNCGAQLSGSESFCSNCGKKSDRYEFREKIRKKLEIESKLKVIFIASTILTLMFWILGAVTEIKIFLAIGFLFMVVAAPSAGLYFELFRPYAKSMKYLGKHGMEMYMDDLSATRFQLPVSKISMGEYLFYSKRSAVIVPYSMVCWVYVHVTKYMGVIPMDETVYLNCRDGKIFEIRASREEMPELLQQILLRSPDLVVGYGDTQSKQYNCIVTEYKQRNLM